MNEIRVAHLAASVALSYPDETVRSKLPLVLAATRRLPDRLRTPLARTLSYLAENDASTVERHYVETFDLRRRCCLYLSYYTHGDTRRRGLALLRFRQVYQAAGLELAEAELPDHLAVLLEFSAAGFVPEANDLLVAHRAGLDLLGHALDGLGSPYAGAVAAVRATLPPPGAADRAAAARLAAEGPPTEQVGLAPVAAGAPAVGAPGPAVGAPSGGGR